MLSYTFQYPFDYKPNLSGWAVLSKKEKCRIKHRLYELMYDLASNFEDFDNLTITSMWRSEKNNLKAGGKSDSKHLKGFAIDFRLNEVSKKLVSTGNYQVLRSVVGNVHCVHVQRSAEYIKSKIMEGK